MDDSIHKEAMSISLADKDISSKLRMVGLGWKVWEVGSFYTIPASEAKPFPFAEGSLGSDSASESIGQPDMNGSVPTSSTSTQPAPQQPPVGASAPPPPPPPPPSQQQSQQPQSSLGKRSRDPNAQPKKAPQTKRNVTVDPQPTGTQPNGSTNVDGEGEKLLWRRHIRRVGWDVLKHWEIWAMDVQEI